MSETDSPVGAWNIDPGARSLRRVGWSAVTLGVVTAVVRGAGAGKEIAVAAAFGRNDAYDAFVVASAVPVFLLGIAAGALTGALVPAIVSEAERGSETWVVGRFVAIAALGLSLIGLLIAVVAPALTALLASGFSPEKQRSAAVLLVVLLPAVVIGGVTACVTSLLHAHSRFMSPAIAQVAGPAVVLVTVVASRDQITATRLAGATVAGVAMELLVVILLLKDRRALLPRRPLLDAVTRRALNRSVPLVAGAVLMGGALLVDQAMAAMLAAGSASALAYGSRLVVTILAIGATAVGSVVLPHFSSSQAHISLQRSYRRIQFALIFTSVPLAFGLFFASRPLVSLIFERGRFGHGDVAIVADVQRLFSAQIPFYLLAVLAARTLAALGHTRPIFWISALNLVTNVVLNIVLGRMIGVAGIALSTSVVYVQSALLLELEIRRAFNRRALRPR